MQNNRPITIYTARSRRDLRLQAAPMDVHELFSRLEQSQAIPYSCDAYKALPKAQQDDLKDIGAYIAGELQNGSRRNGCVLTRCAAVLDADNLSVGGTGDFLRRRWPGLLLLRPLNGQAQPRRAASACRDSFCGRYARRAIRTRCAHIVLHDTARNVMV